MSGVLISIMWGLLGKLATEAFAGKMLVYGLSAISEKTTNKVDDVMVKAVADALGVSVPK